MFRAVLCSSSGGQILCIQHMVSSLSMSDRGGLTYTVSIYIFTSHTTLIKLTILSDTT